MSGARKQRKVVVLGFSFVGKTAISVRFCADRFNERYEPTYENSFRRVIRHRGQDIDVVITDTQGQDEQELFRNEYCLGAHAYVLVFSLTSPRSLQNVKVINDKLINLIGHTKIPRVLVGSKQDLDTDRRIPIQECLDLSREWGVPYVECSAKQNLNVDEVFRLSLQEIDRFSDDDIVGAAPWWACPRIPKFSPPSPELTMTVIAITCIAWACGLVGIGVWEAVRPKSSDVNDVEAYLLFGFGLLTMFASVMGLIGIRNMRHEYIRGYALFTWALLLTEAVVAIVFVCGGIGRRAVSLLFSVPAVVASVVQFSGALIAWQLQRDLRHVIPDDFDHYVAVPNDIYP
ncbi:Ras family [Plasmodiophora brassicae]|nr:hypothetical protein PBRA_008030 [Plasmodiophora brassicae]